MPKTLRIVIKSRKKFQWSWFFIFKLFLGVLNIPENYSSIRVAVPEIWYMRARASARSVAAEKCTFFDFFIFVFRPQMPPNRLVWFFISPLKSENKFFGGYPPLKGCYSENIIRKSKILLRFFLHHYIKIYIFYTIFLLEK